MAADRFRNSLSTASLASLDTFKDSGETKQDEPHLQVVLNIVKADLWKSFEAIGKMDPYAVVCYSLSDGRQWEVARTHTLWNAHRKPEWKHKCPPQDYLGSNDAMMVQVFDDNFLTKPTLCGEAQVLITEMLVGSEVRKSAQQEASVVRGPERDVPLYNKNEQIGLVTLQVSLCSSGSVADHDLDLRLTSVDPDMFEKPVKRIGVSGGTAPFFKLQLHPNAEPGRSRTFYIGKDLSRASDEVTFYEQVLEMFRDSTKLGDLGPLLSFTFEYKGIFKAAEEGDDVNAKPKELLVLRNLFDGAAAIRLLDIKIGQKTAAAGWQGKSRLRAMKQDLLDGLTNSVCEGYRLEGFDGPPAALRSMDPLHDVGRLGPVFDGTTAAKKKFEKKAFRMMLQRMTAREMFVHFLDVHDIAAPDETMLQSRLSPTEVSEVVLHEIVCRLAHLSMACHQASVPQKWIGSSVALGFDTGTLPPRGQEGELRDSVIVHIFDWGRSELNTEERNRQLSAKEQKDRGQFWQYYHGGIDRLAWEAAWTYWHRFSNAQNWKEISVVIMDFDAVSKSDFIGRTSLPIERAKGKRVALEGVDGLSLFGAHKAQATLSYSMDFRSFPKGSRLSGVWQVQLQQANDLPALDSCGTSDPFAIVTATSAEGHSFQQQSRVIIRNTSPEWNEMFEFPVAASSDQLQAGLNSVADGLGSTLPFMDGCGLGKLFPTGEDEQDLSNANTSFRREASSSSARGTLRSPKTSTRKTTSTPGAQQIVFATEAWVAHLQDLSISTKVKEYQPGVRASSKKVGSAVQAMQAKIFGIGSLLKMRPSEGCHGPNRTEVLQLSLQADNELLEKILSSSSGSSLDFMARESQVMELLQRLQQSIKALRTEYAALPAEQRTAGLQSCMERELHLDGLRHRVEELRAGFTMNTEEVAAPAPVPAAVAPSKDSLGSFWTCCSVCKKPSSAGGSAPSSPVKPPPLPSSKSYP